MKKFKKLVALVLAFAMVLSMNVVSFAAAKDFADVTDADQQEAVALLTTLGVVNGYPDGTYKPANVVTRAEMAKLVIAALGYSSLANATTTNYSDMGAAAWANGFVGLADGIGVVKGYPDGTFKPNNTVTYAEAATMIVRALGYTDASLAGTWPNNYLAKAMDLDLFDNTDMMGSGATRGDIAVMLFNAIDQEIGKVNADNEWVGAAAGKDIDNMITRLGAVKMDSAVITGDEDTAINLRAWVGVYASGYMNDDDEIILLNQEESVLVGEFDGADTFEVDGKDYTIRSTAKAGVVHFVNGESVTTAALNVDFTETEEVVMAAKVSGSYITKVYAVSAWEVTSAFLAEEDDLDAIADDNELREFSFIEDDDDAIDTWEFEVVGVDSVDEIQEDDVVYVYANSNDEIRKVAVGVEAVAGKITRKTSDDKYTIGGRVYELVDDAIVAVKDDSTTIVGAVGDTVEVKLDAFGYIYEMKEEEDAKADTYAILLDSEDGDSTKPLSGGNPLVELFLADETTKVFTVDADDVGYDVSTITGYAIGALVKYSVDSNGEIDALEFPELTEGDGDISSRGYYEGKLLATNILIFSYDGDDTVAQLGDEDNYKVASRSSVLDTKNVDSLYQVDEDTNRIDVMVITSGEGEDGIYGLVDDYATIDNGTDYEFTVWIDGSAVVIGTDLDPTDYYMTGELYEIVYYADGTIKNLIAVYEDSNDDTEAYAAVAGSTYNSSTNSLDGRTLDENLLVYKFDGTDFEVKARRDIKDAAYVYAYDIVDADGVIDIVVLSSTELDRDM